ncbi:MAG: hypothetical protein AABY22_06865 [Nanoarchaeota archaeon]
MNKYLKIWIKYTILGIGIIGLMHFWGISVEKIGFWNFMIGYTIYVLCDGIADAMDKDKE